MSPLEYAIASLCLILAISSYRANQERKKSDSVASYFLTECSRKDEHIVELEHIIAEYKALADQHIEELMEQLKAEGKIS